MSTVAQKVATHLANQFTAAREGGRVEWFTESFPTVASIAEEISEKSLNDKWLELFKKDGKRFTPESERMLAEILVAARLRRAVLSKYVAEGSHPKTFIDLVRYAMTKRQWFTKKDE